MNPRSYFGLMISKNPEKDIILMVKKAALGFGGAERAN
jgi:hypothetical protein